ncbi:MAG TPA: hypothetical protein VFI77_04315, partial [Gemmatimonadales bacterium]|nr:hypothetical protein [Gemmatimonadales bacterium]
MSNVDTQYGCAEQTYQLWSLIRDRITVMLSSSDAAVVQDGPRGVLPFRDIGRPKEAVNEVGLRLCNNPNPSTTRLGGGRADGHMDAAGHLAVPDHTLSLLRRALYRQSAQANDCE